MYLYGPRIVHASNRHKSADNGWPIPLETRLTTIWIISVRKILASSSRAGAYPSVLGIVR
jgi:hypothetical protein